MCLVTLGHVCGDGGVPVSVVIARMGRYPSAAVKDLHGSGGEPGFQLFAGHFVRDPIVL